MPLGYKILVPQLLLLALLLGASGVLYFDLIRQKQSLGSTGQRLEEAARLADLLQGFETESALNVLSYRVDGKPWRLEAAAWSDHQSEAVIDAYVPSITDSRQEALHKAVAEAHGRIRSSRTGLILAIDSGVENDIQAAFDRWRIHRRVLAANLTDWSAFNLDRFAATSRRALEERNAIVRYFFFAVAVAIAITVFTFFYVHATVSRRLRILASSIAAFGSGKLGARIDPLIQGSADEIGQVAKAFNGMAVEIERRSAQLGAATDDIRKSNAALRDAQGRFRATVESAPIAMVMINQAGAMVLANRETNRLFGYEQDELLSQNIEILIPDRFRAKHPGLRTGYFSAPEARTMGAGRDLYGQRKDGSEFAVEIGLNPVTTGEGLFVLAAINDITERTRQTEALKKSNEALERKNIEVLRSAAQLEGANKDLETFAYSVSHDLRAPLRAMDGFSQAILEDYGPKLDEEGKDNLRRVREAAQRMGHLIDDMLKLSRVTRDEMDIHAVDLTLVAEGIVAELKETGQARNVEVSIEPGVIAQGDARLLEAVLTNLFSNAWKFTAKKERGVIEFGAEKVGDELVCHVRDNGAGFDMAYAANLFGPFQRLHHASEFQGNGIGLATIKRIIARHGGRVWAKGAVDNGATFYFALPDTSTARG